MGPTNQALVKLFDADQKYREAQARYDAAAHDVRIQERRVNDLSGKLQLSQTQLLEQQAKAASAELDIKARDTQIEKLRVQQQTAQNNKEYQNFLIQINTEKVDKAKSEDALLKVMEQVERLQGEVKQAASLLEAETQKLEQMRQQIIGRLEVMKKEVDDLKPARDAAAAGVSARNLEAFERLAERFDGEAMAAIQKPDRRIEEYTCSACNMEMAVDLYNRLHNRDEVLFCPSCRRMLYIPEDLPPEQAVNQRKKTKKQEEPEAPEAAAGSNGSAETIPSSQA
jgi:uncharacterized protein